jgi:4-hydroxy-tetrahydrodipicolinate reductase
LHFVHIEKRLNLIRMKIALIGYGAMGRLIEELAASRGHSIVVKIDETNSDDSVSTMANKLANADVAIDFSAAEAIERNVEACLSAGIALVEGTTGWKPRQVEIERMVRAADGAFVFGANFSVGVNLFYRIVDFAAELISKFPEYEAFIEEQHHSRKKDAPSGTALKLKSIVDTHIAKEFSVSSTRAGNIPGTHRVGFDAPADQILLEHRARSREGFAIGAIMAAEWIAGKKGFYEFGDVIDRILDR